MTCVVDITLSLIRELEHGAFCRPYLDRKQVADFELLLAIRIDQVISDFKPSKRQI